MSDLQRGERLGSLAVVGTQWGDEGKGKITDYLAQDADLVVRFQGGANAGHTIEIEKEVFALHLLPSGILSPGIINVIGNGVVLDLEELEKEIAVVKASGRSVDGLRLHLDGCPHACAQHWVGDLGFQGTTVRDADGRAHQAYDVYLRGGLDRPAAIARPVFRRVPTDELDGVVAGLVDGWLGARRTDETFRSFCERSSDDELSRLAGRDAAPTRRKEAA